MSIDPRPSDAELLARPHTSTCTCRECMSVLRSIAICSVCGAVRGPLHVCPSLPRRTRKPRPPRVSEKAVEHAGDRLMHAHGFTAVRFSQARATRQSPGIPDRRYIHAERRLAVWWEAKAPGGKQRPAQRAFQILVESVGERYLLGGVEALEGWLASVARDEAAEKTAAERRLGVSSPAYTVDEFGAPIVPPPTP